MNTSIQQTIETLAKEKGIDPEEVISAIEEAVLTASRKYYKTDENLKTTFNRETGSIELFAVKVIVPDSAIDNEAQQISLTAAQELYGDDAEVDMEIDFPKPTDVLGRIAAQTAKQVIFQKVREAERENIYAEYNNRLYEVVSGSVKRFESGDIVVETGRMEALLPRREQSWAENYNTGDRIRAVIIEVNKNTKGPQIILSRTHEKLLEQLFLQEVPEIYDGTVKLFGAVREAGDRAKVAVFSSERDIDPVGACVGMKGNRVQAIIRELRGEKIDIIEWSEDPIVFITNAISPARAQRVTVTNDIEKEIEVVVEERQLSLAIGKKGQNVRLAAKLTGWKIDIKDEDEKRREVEAQFDGLSTEDSVTLTLPGLDDDQIRNLANAGFDTADRLLEASSEKLSEVAGVDKETAEQLHIAVREQVEAAQKASLAAVEENVTEIKEEDSEQNDVPNESNL
tara:strand:+ start:31 stop:1395 length:1365 start_codon:yes stop_codon:yes gene_type:complete